MGAWVGTVAFAMVQLEMAVHLRKRAAGTAPDRKAVFAFVLRDTELGTEFGAEFHAEVKQNYWTQPKHGQI